MSFIQVFDGLFAENELAAVHECGKQLILDKPRLGMFYRHGTTELFDQVKNKDEYDVLFTAYHRLLTEHIFDLYNINTEFGAKHTGFEFHRYEVGDVCETHADGEISSQQISNPENKVLADIRFAAVVLCLTNNSGGDLVFPKQDTVIPAKRGRVIVFPPYTMFPHHTTAATEQRDVIVTWFAYEKVLAVNPKIFGQQ